MTTASWVLNSVYYKADWLDDYHRLYYVGNSRVSTEHSMAITLTVIFSGVPEGNHTITLVANYHDSSQAYDTVSFRIDT